MRYLITTPVSRQYDGMWEVEWALQGKLKMKKTSFKGLFFVKTDKDALKLINDYETTAICRVIPLELVVKTDKDAITEKALALAKRRIEKGETFAVRCKNRGEKLDSQKLERELGEKILNTVDNLKVNLEFPQKTVKIEVFGKETGLSILEEGDILKKEVVE
ncbi:MAG: THUMP domain-containing protein [Euryarchaeota archaeon]|nr:THUMP domain-containing protein [Euryarchaeota archaeon]